MTPEELAQQAGIPLATAKALMTGNPTITVAEAKAASNGSGAKPAPAPAFVVDTGSAALGFGNAAAAQQGAPVEWTIPMTSRLGANGGRSDNLSPLNPGQVTRSDQLKEADAQTYFGNLIMDPAKLKEFSQLAFKANLISALDMQDAWKLGAAWDKAVSLAVNMKAATNGRTEVTPFEALDIFAKNTGSALLAQQQFAKDHFTGDRTQTTTQTDLRNTSQEGDVLRQLLGRKPTAGENAAYQHGLDRVAAANPTKSTSVDTVKDGVVTGTTNTLTGGYDEKAAMLDQASKDPAVQAEQSATTYYSALVNALGAAV